MIWLFPLIYSILLVLFGFLAGCLVQSHVERKYIDDKFMYSDNMLITIYKLFVSNIPEDENE